jgi:flagellar hook-associated protein FlgK
MIRVITSILVYLFITCGLANQVVMAAPPANEMQICQAVLDFVDDKLTQTSTLYAEADIDKIKKGLSLYNQYIQSEIVDPAVISFSRDDQTQIKNIQQQLSDYKTEVVQQLQARYSAVELYTDQVFAINNCIKKAMPKEEVLHILRISVTTMLALARQ